MPAMIEVLGQPLDCFECHDEHVVLRLNIGPFWGALLLVHRNGREAITIDLEEAGTLREARLPELDKLAHGRWDLWLVPPQGNQQRLKGMLSAEAEADKHFFSTASGKHGLSAYLTDTQQSIALYVDDVYSHQTVTAAENARHGYPRFLRDLPLIENLVFFESFLGKAYAGNPRYLYEELLRTRPDLRYVWAYNGSKSIPGNPEVVVRGSAEYCRLLAQAKYRVNNIRFPVYGKKPETVYLQTWHGTPLKRLSFDITVSGPEVDAREALFQESQAWSVLLSENAYSSEILARAFRYEGDILEAGYPLTDALLKDSPAMALAINSLGLAPHKRYFLYAPTWRDNKSLAAWQHKFDLNLDLALLSDALPDETVLLIKAHHLVSEKLDKAQLPENIQDMSHVDDINDLCKVSSALITDYSSVFFDYAVTGRPILFYCYDLEEYMRETRGLYMDVRTELPGPVAQTTSELADYLRNLGAVEREYASRYAAFQSRFCSLNDGRVSARVARMIFGVPDGD